MPSADIAGLTGPAGLRVDVEVARAGGFALRATFVAPAGETTAIVGPNGAGKTTLLRAIAGLEPTATGRIAAEDHALLDTATGVDVPAGERGVAVSFQGAHLFPGLDVVDNVAFGRRASGARRAAARAEAVALLAELDLADLADRRPGQLSGGEAARVSLARAVLVRPRVLLLDEPFAAVDARARPDLRRWATHVLGRQAEPPTTLLVTPDPADAFALAAHAVVLEDGAVVQQGPPRSLADAPATPYVADLVGVVRWPATATAEGILVDGGPTLPPRNDLAAGPCTVIVDPTAIAVARTATDGEPAPGRWATTVVDVVAGARHARVRLASPPGTTAELSLHDRRAPDVLALRPGESVTASLADGAGRVHPSSA